MCQKKHTEPKNYVKGIYVWTLLGSEWFSVILEYLYDKKVLQPNRSNITAKRSCNNKMYLCVKTNRNENSVHPGDKTTYSNY